jgi:preprotein translocase subunit SecF
MRFWPLVKVLPVKTNLHFVRWARLFSSLSVVAVVGSLFLTLYPFKPPCFGLACGIDFKGGTILQIDTAPLPFDANKVRGALAGVRLGDVEVQGIGGPTTAMVRFQTPQGGDAAATTNAVRAHLKQALGQVTFSAPDTVGAKVSSELLSKGLFALGGAILLMLIYIWFRFELQFGLGAVAALFHDVFLTFGLIALSGRLSEWTGGAIKPIEFNLQAVAGILTIIGYSMNDTVVVFDRFRENLRKYKRMPLREVIDLSINEMLTRTILTSFTGIVALVALAVLGGPTLYGLSVIMLFGIVVGTYSSIYIAAPVIMLWGVKRGDDDVVEVLKPQPNTRY